DDVGDGTGRCRFTARRRDDRDDIEPGKPTPEHFKTVEGGEIVSRPSAVEEMDSPTVLHDSGITEKGKDRGDAGTDCHGEDAAVVDESHQICAARSTDEYLRTGGAAHEGGGRTA